MTAPVISGAAIGRYFTVVSLVPSFAFVAYVMLLVRSHSWSGSVDFGTAVSDLELDDFAVFGVSVLVLAVSIHPLQFAIIQGFEGFWGGSSFGRRFAVRHILRHRRTAFALQKEALEKTAQAHRQRGQADPEKGERVGEPFASWPHASGDHVSAFFTAGEAWRRYGRYPDEYEYIMPTQLGNVLRRYELMAGMRFGLDTIAAVPRLMQIADSRDVAYVHNQRIQMELALRTAALALVATPLTLFFMWNDGWWLLLALVPYGVAFVSYRGAVVIAHEYGTALAVLVELNRFALYERMHLPVPSTLAAERRYNKALTDVLRLDNVTTTRRWRETMLPRYVHPQPPPFPTPPAPPSAGGNQTPE